MHDFQIQKYNFIKAESIIKHDSIVITLKLVMYPCLTLEIFEGTNSGESPIILFL